MNLATKTLGNTGLAAHFIRPDPFGLHREISAANNTVESSICLLMGS